jgi:hypothetical protein
MDNIKCVLTATGDLKPLSRIGSGIITHQRSMAIGPTGVRERQLHALMVNILNRDTIVDPREPTYLPGWSTNPYLLTSIHLADIDTNETNI